MQKQVDITTNSELALQARRKPKFTILYVDDEPHNLRVFKSSFRRNFNVITAESPYEAMEMLKQHKVHLIVTDQKMPGMNGTEFLEKVLPDYPQAISMIITGFSDIDDIAKAINKCGIYSYVTKPWDAGELKQTLDKAIEVYTLKTEKEELINELFEASMSLEQKVDERTEELSKVNSRLFESIDYALSIQTAILPSEQILKNNFEDSFAYYSAQDIVSGDFYYLKRVGQKIVAAAMDCTGHGVPGALLSILGSTALEAIVHDAQVTDGKEIMDILNHKVYAHLAENANQGYHDGMDGTIMTIDLDQQTVELYAANSDVIYYQNGEQKRFKGNRFSIGNDPKIEEMDGITLPMGELSEIYLFSDGYKDQLNQANIKKFGMNRFMELLDEIHTEDMSAQKERLNEEKLAWKGSDDQNDDIMVIGLRL